MHDIDVPATFETTSLVDADTRREREFRYIGRHRRASEHRRFVIGAGNFVQDVAVEGMKHVAVLASPHPAARILKICTRDAEASPGVAAVLTGADLAEQIDPLPHGVDVPNILWYPLAVDCVRYAGEWVAAVVADTRHQAEDALELIEVDYEPAAFVVDPEVALEPSAPLVHALHGSNVLYRRTFTWGPVAERFAGAPNRTPLRVKWSRNASVPIETFGVAARWDDGNGILDVWASVQMPKFPDLLAAALRLPGTDVRVRYDVDVGGSYGTKRGLKHAVLAGFLARKLHVPVRLIEDRLENMSGGDFHGPDRIFDLEAAYEDDGRIRAIRMRALDDCGAFPGRAPLQLGKPIGAIVGPYRIEAVEYEAISVCTNKTGQIPVRGFGQAPTNYALEALVDHVAAETGIDRAEIRRRNMIRHDEFPYRIPSGTEYDSGDYHTVFDKLLGLAETRQIWRRRDEIRKQGRLAGVGVSTCLEPGGGNAAFEPLMNPKNQTTAWLESSLVRVDRRGAVSVVIGTGSAGQGHETLAATVVGEELALDPDSIRVVRADSLEALPGNSPVASRMAIMLGGAAAGAARKIRMQMMKIAAHRMQCETDDVIYGEGGVRHREDPGKYVSWQEIVSIAHTRNHELPPDMEPGLQATFVLQVPKGGTLPDAKGRVQMYPCFSFEAHVALLSVDPGTGHVDIEDYLVAHDCGTVINPDIVRGMVLGGIAHGIGAALYEEFRYDAATGQHLSGSFADYPIPSTHEVPDVTMIEHCTPSPLTVYGQKGTGEAGYMGAPAAVASAVNDALAPLGCVLRTLPMTLGRIGEALCDASPHLSVDPASDRS